MAAFNLNEFIDIQNQVLSDFESLFPSVMTTVGSDIVTLVRDRVQQTSQTAQGGSFSDYSPSYLTVRLEAGKQAFKDFTFTGDMWRDYKVISTSGSGTTARTRIGVTRSDNIEKLTNLSDQEQKSIVEPSSEDIRLGGLTLEAQIERIIEPLR